MGDDQKRRQSRIRGRADSAPNVVLNTGVAETFAAAIRHHRARRLQQAEALYRKVISGEPDHYDAHCYLGLALHGQGKLDQSVASYLNAIDLKPGDAAAHNNLGNSLKALGRLEEAVGCYR